MSCRAGLALLAVAMAPACGTGEAPRLGLGEICTTSSECLAGRACTEVVPGRVTVCGEWCGAGAGGCDWPAYPDAWCMGEAPGARGVCVVPCASDPECPGDLVCGADGRCVPPAGPWAAVAGPLPHPAEPAVDLLVAVDNSGSMAEEQGILVRQLPEVLRELFDPPDENGDTVPDRPAVLDLNLGVISSDMGTMGHRVTTCANPDAGDDGCLLHDPSPIVPGCAARYPAFLSRNPDNAATYPLDAIAADFACIGTLGTGGCGFEQQLKALGKAVVENQAPGACNEGFLRERSIAVLLWVTDENDCSVDPAHPEMFDESRRDLGHLSVRCFLHPEMLVPVERYVDVFRRLRSFDPDRLVFATIAGVPPDERACSGFGDRLGACLAAPAMQERMNSDGDGMELVCIWDGGIAYPAVRLVRVAQSLGRSGLVGSICRDDWSDTFRSLAARVAGALQGPCIDGEVPFDPARCEVTSCRIVERLPGDWPCPADPGCRCGASGCTDPATGERCEPLRRDGGTVAEGGRTYRRCVLRQAARTPVGDSCPPPATEGWYYVPASSSASGCARIVLGGPAGPLVDPASAVYLECRDLP